MSLYPPLAPRQQFHLPVSGGHRLYVEECGNPQGRPVLVVHGGPGAGCSPHLRRFFDPQHWRIILFDQRGAGRSEPLAETQHNTTDDLVADMERLRQHFGIERWMLFGGSWGATLSLRYASQYPERVSAMVLRGVYLCRQQDMDWLYCPDGAARLQPEAWRELAAPLITHEVGYEGGSVLVAWHRLLNQTEGLERWRLADIWSGWEVRCATVLPETRQGAALSDLALSMAMIETHYFVQGGFLEGWPMPPPASVLGRIPGVIVHGRLDLVCPAEQALILHEQWPGSRLVMVEGAGHSVREPGIQAALLEAVASLVGVGEEA